MKTTLLVPRNQGQALTNRQKKKKGTFFKELLQQKYLFLMLLPAVVTMLIFNYGPMYGLIIAFKRYDVFLGFSESPWIGLANFKEVFMDVNFLYSIRNTVIISLFKLIVGFPLPIIFAILLNEMRNKTYKKTVQTVSYLPHFISWVFVAGYLATLLSPNSGAFNEILLSLGIIKKPIFFMGKAEYYRWILVFSDIWKNLGWSSIIYIAAITGINPELYQAAIIDGAGRFARMWHITLPSILGTVMILLVLKISNLLNQSFDQVYLTISPLTRDVGEIIDTYAFRLGIKLGRFSYATTVGLFKAVVAAILLLLANKTSHKLTEKSLF